MTWVTTCTLQFSAFSSCQLAVALVCSHLQLVHSKLLKITQHCLAVNNQPPSCHSEGLTVRQTIQNREIFNTVLTHGKVLSYFISLILMKMFSPYDRHDSSVLKRLKKRLINNSWKCHVFEVLKCANPGCSLKSIVWTGTIAETKLITCTQNPLAKTE